MAKFASNNWLDGSLSYLKDNCDKMVICATQPTTYTEATATNKLAEQAMVTGDFTLSTSGSNRRCTVGAKAGLSVTATGTADHVAFVKTGTSELIFVTTATSQAITSGGTVDIPAITVDNNAPA